MNLDGEGGEWMNVYFPFDVVRTSFIVLLMRFGGGIGEFNGISVKVGVVDVLLTL